MNSRIPSVAFRSSALAIALFAGTVQADSWHRSSDWIPGTTHGSTAGNPSSVGGQPAWQYEWVNGGPLGSINAWYAQPGTKMTWDSAWFATGAGAWAKGDNVNPVVQNTKVTHNMTPAYFGDIPVVRWLNPLGNGNLVDITGSLEIKWAGTTNLTSVPNVDVALAKYDASTNLTTLLYSTTALKPTPGGAPETVTVPVSLQAMFDAGDSLVISHRAHASASAGWIATTDDITITQVIPAPGAMALLGLGGLVAARRRR